VAKKRSFAANVREHLCEFQPQWQQRIALLRPLECDCHEVCLTFHQQMLGG